MALRSLQRTAFVRTALKTIYYILARCALFVSSTLELARKFTNISLRVFRVRVRARSSSALFFSCELNLGTHIAPWKLCSWTTPTASKAALLAYVGSAFTAVGENVGAMGAKFFFGALRTKTTFANEARKCAYIELRLSSNEGHVKYFMNFYPLYEGLNNYFLTKRFNHERLQNHFARL